MTFHTSETPIRTELRGYFCEVLKPAPGYQKMQRRRRVELSCTGEVLTSDEVLERLEKAVADREAKNELKERLQNEHKHQSPLCRPDVGDPHTQLRVPLKTKSIVKVVDKRTQLMKRRVGSGVTIVSPGGITGVQDFPICSLQTERTTIALK